MVLRGEEYQGSSQPSLKNVLKGIAASGPSGSRTSTRGSCRATHLAPRPGIGRTRAREELGHAVAPSASATSMMRQERTAAKRDRASQQRQGGRYPRARGGVELESGPPPGDRTRKARSSRRSGIGQPATNTGANSKISSGLPSLGRAVRMSGIRPPKQRRRTFRGYRTRSPFCGIPISKSQADHRFYSSRVCSAAGRDRAVAIRNRPGASASTGRSTSGSDPCCRRRGCRTWHAPSRSTP